MLVNVVISVSTAYAHLEELVERVLAKVHPLQPRTADIRHTVALRRV